ncbi:MAG TPA: diacylglycerol kinase family protein [Conexibacter sp.]|jgi:YegS/Rv2252/BmrU family lipid kinase
MDRDVALIVNPSAGGGRMLRLLPGVERWLRAHRVGFHVERTRDIEHARELGLQAAQAGEVAAAFGGDGIVGAIAGALVGTDGLLAVLPGGRGNDFARALGIPRSPVAACSVFEHGRERRIDVGDVDGRRFVGIASCGFDSDANRIANETRVPGGAAYAYAAVRALMSWRPARFTVTIDDHELRFRGYSVAAANGPAFGGGMFLAPDARLDDGLFDVVSIAGVSRLRYIALLPTVFKGAHVRVAEVDIRRAREITITADRPFTLYADGDPIAELPATIRTLPGAVRVLVP